MHVAGKDQLEPTILFLHPDVYKELQPEGGKKREQERRHQIMMTKLMVRRFFRRNAPSK